MEPVYLALNDAQNFSKIIHLQVPIAHLLQAIAVPLTSFYLSKNFMEVIIEREDGWKKMLPKGMAFIGIQFVPYILMILNSVGSSITN